LVQFKRPQTTIAAPVTVSGFGFWSGLDVSLQFKPAAENTGIFFRRADIDGSPRVEASIVNRVSGPRRTTLVKDKCSVEMVEHVLSALAGLKIDNCEVVTDRAEMPGMDGSSLPFVEALTKAGTVQQDASRKVTHVTESVRVGDNQSWIQLEPSEHNRFELCFQLDYPTCPSVGQQTFSSTLNLERYRASIAPARTFVLKEEADQLLRQGLGARVTYDDILIFDDNGPIGNELRFSDECARHKVLDMIGDFSLLGTDIVGKFTAFKSGHRLNSQVVFELLRQRGSEEPGRQRISA
jgi:UDP-3-O-acyl N-acetylglucosamine deacetylase